MAPSNVTVKAVMATEMDVSWNSVEHHDMNGVLLGYEVRDRTETGTRQNKKQISCFEVSTPDEASHFTELANMNCLIK